MNIKGKLKNDTELLNTFKNFIKYLNEFSSNNDKHIKRHIPHEPVKDNKKIENPFKQVNVDKTSNMNNINTKLKVDKDGQLFIPFPEYENEQIFSKFVTNTTNVPTIGNTTNIDKYKKKTIDFTETIMEYPNNITPLTVDPVVSYGPNTYPKAPFFDPFDPAKTFHRDPLPFGTSKIIVDGDKTGITVVDDGDKTEIKVADKVTRDITKLLIDDNDESAIITTFEKNLNTILNSISKFLKEKNKRYGNSALEPSNMFFKGNSEEGLRIRIDDKLKRIKNSDVLRKNDIVDLIGYLIILCITKGWLSFNEFID
jgi:hypothetical protein